jgi:hypothetical protein
MGKGAMLDELVKEGTCRPIPSGGVGRQLMELGCPSDRLFLSGAS